MLHAFNDSSWEFYIADYENLFHDVECSQIKEIYVQLVYAFTVLCSGVNFRCKLRNLLSSFVTFRALELRHTMLCSMWKTLMKLIYHKNAPHPIYR